MRQHYKVAMNAQCQKLVPVLMLLERKATTNKLLAHVGDVIWLPCLNSRNVYRGQSSSFHGTLPYRPDRMAEWIGFREIRRFGPHGFEPWSSQTIGLKLTYLLVTSWHMALLGYGKDRLAQCQDSMTEWDIRSWCRWPGLPVRQHFNMAVSALS